MPDLRFSISYTTRKPRGAKFTAVNTTLWSRDTFEEMIRKGDFLEYADVFGNYYGTARSFLDEARAEGKDLLLDIDVQGAGKSRNGCRKR